MKRLTIITLAALLLQAVAHAELSGGEPVRLLAKPVGSALSVDLDDRIVSRPARFTPVELPRNTPDFGASLPEMKLRADWTRALDLVHNTETGAIGKVFTMGFGALLYLLALTVIVYVRQARARRIQRGSRVALALPTPCPVAAPLSTPKR